MEREDQYMQQQENKFSIEKLFDGENKLFCPLEINDDELLVVSQNGDILKYDQKSQNVNIDFDIAGTPRSVAIDRTGQNIFIADLAHQAIICKTNEDGNDKLFPLFKDFEGFRLLGPNSLAISTRINCLFFSDSGPFGETSIENPKGSIFWCDLEDQKIEPLALNCLAYPTGIALNNDENILYVCETCKNRVIRYVGTPDGDFFQSPAGIFYQFSGRFGPIDVAVSSENFICVARFEFANLSTDGLISILKDDGQKMFVENVKIPGYPSITGICFSKYRQNNTLYATDNSKTPIVLKIKLQKTQEDEDIHKVEDAEPMTAGINLNN